MHVIQRAAQVPYSAAQMYKLVNDVEKYPQFLPWCDKVMVSEHTPTSMQAAVEVSKAGIRKAFSTRNTLRQDQSIDMQLKSGGLANFEGSWRFYDNANGSQVQFKLQFAFKNRLLKLTIGILIDQIANTLVDAFVQRAHHLYRNNS